jgi:hypothetical protein
MDDTSRSVSGYAPSLRVVVTEPCVVDVDETRTWTRPRTRTVQRLDVASQGGSWRAGRGRGRGHAWKPDDVVMLKR